MLRSIKLCFIYAIRSEDFVVYVISVMKSREAVVSTELYSTTVIFYNELQFYASDRDLSNRFKSYKNAKMSAILRLFLRILKRGK